MENDMADTVVKAASAAPARAQPHQRLNRALRTVRAVNRALLQASREADLLQEICRVVIEEGGYRLAWVSQAGHDAQKSIRPVAYAGFEQGWLETLHNTWADTERGRAPTGKAIRSGEPQVVRDVLNDPRDGLIGPGECVKLAERTGLMLPLTHWVLDAAFRQTYAWHQAGIGNPLAVNLSAADLRDPKLIDHIKGGFATWGSEPEDMQFELTQSALMEDPAGALETLLQLKSLGVRLLVDDFGTGYSSLSYLQKLPVDTIKIDQSFISKVTASEPSSEIVRCITELAHRLRLEVVAEGVEDQATWERIAAIGCDVVQGYWVSKPMPVGEFSEWQTQSRWHA